MSRSLVTLGGTIATPHLIIGVDTGGTFTDCVVIDGESGGVVTSKALSTPHDFSIGLFESIERAAAQMELSLDELIGRTAQIVVGTTVATNAFVERKGANTGMLVTKGFRDTLFIMRGVGRVTGQPPEKQLLLETTRKPEPVVPKHLVREVEERADWAGEVLRAPDRSEVLASVRQLVDEGVEAIAICFLWAFKQPANEASVSDWIRAEFPDLYVSCSHEVAPKMGEYERFAAAAINAYVGPKTARYLDHVGSSLRGRGYGQRLLVMGCDGGVRSDRVAAREAIVTLNSGPAGGVTGSALLGRHLGIQNVITADVGGTSFDVGMIRDGAIQSGETTVLGQYEFFIPAVDVQSIGAGGGSIAWIDRRRGTLSVGPESAGVDPGPVCYGRGGTRPTLTDAALVLGYLSEISFLGSGGGLDVEGARGALAQLGSELGLSWEETAAGIVRIAESHMSDLVRRMVVSKGYDPRDFSLFAYGGAGPVHAVGLVRDLSLASIVVPAGNAASVWSAYGVGTSDIKHVYEYSEVFEEPLDSEGIRDVCRRLGDIGRARLAEEQIPVETTRFLYEIGVRYRGQLHDVYVPVADAEQLDDEGISRLIADFERAYARVFGEGTGFRQAGLEVVDFRLTTVSAVQRPPLREVGVREEDARKGERLVRFVGLDGSSLGTPIETAVYDGEAVPAGAVIGGPSVIELAGTTIVVAPDYRATRHESGSYVLTQR